jgi:tRNA nucleotidyltransferase (CCA-adding enzyme)
MIGLSEFNKNSIERATQKILNNYGYGHDAWKLLESLGTVSEDAGCRSYLIGGFPRDIFIYMLKSYPETSDKYKSSTVFETNSRFLDLDIAVEGGAEKLAGFLKRDIGSKFKINYLKIHNKFGTVLIEFSVNGLPLKIDLASLRTEEYQSPGSLPKVNTRGISLEYDMRRRDFTINTVAFSLNRKDFFETIDYSSGLSDIFKKKIRILHELSFIDDPTRMFRAVRFEKRLAFRIDRKTVKLIEIAIGKKVLDNISGKRIFSEIDLLLKEKNPAANFERLEKLGILKGIYPKLAFDKKNKAVFKKIYKYFNESCKNSKQRKVFKQADAGIFYAAEILYGLNAGELSGVAARLNIGGRLEKTLKTIYCGIGEISALKINNLFNLNLKNTEIYDKLNKIDKRSILFYLFKSVREDAADFNFIKIIKKYLNEIMFIAPQVNGNDIKSLGVGEGPLCGKILGEIRLLKISGRLNSKKDEIKYIKENYLKI